MVDFQASWQGVPLRGGEGRTKPAFASGVVADGFNGDTRDVVFFESESRDIYAQASCGSWLMIPADQRINDRGEHCVAIGALQQASNVLSWSRVETEIYEDDSEIADPDVLAWLAEVRKDFLRPEVSWCDGGSVDVEVLFGGDADPRDYPAGYYARLSASGYLDATDFVGPYATLAEALIGLYETFGE